MRYQCSHCGRKFSRRTALRNHIKIHDSEIDRILDEIAKESTQPVENEKEMNYEDQEMIITEESKEEMVNAEEESVNTEEFEEELIIADVQVRFSLTMSDSTKFIW